ncbi:MULTISPECIES: sulfotransferase [Methylocaldum]|uniref:sulfotransferase n=1 Tax=Methylocaldum TaxID=73778 RepID=UPI0003FB1145|nr:sulfotransferase [Methylocaldum szegediense]
MQTELKRDIQIKAPVLILSLKRSGSTLLRNIIDSHPDIFASAFMIGPLCEALYSTSYLSLAHLANGLTESRRRERAVAKAGEIVDRLMQSYVAEGHARFWCDKSLVNLNHLQTIRQVLPEARYICLYRQCLDVVQSYISMCRLGFLPEVCGHIQKSPHNAVAAIAEYWVERNSAILEFEKANAGRCYRVNYETLVRQPQETLSGLFAFLGLEWDDALLEKTFGKPRDGFAEGDIKFHFSKQVHTDSIGSGASLPLNTLPAPLRARMEALLAELGYSEQSATVERPKARVDVAAVLEQFKQAIDRKADYGRTIGGTCKLVISGFEQQEWTIDLTKPKGVIEPGGRATDCVISLAADTLIDLAAGKRSVVEAFENGAIGIAGNVSLATSFGKLLLA